MSIFKGVVQEFHHFPTREPRQKTQVVLVTGQVCSEERALEFQSCFLGVGHDMGVSLNDGTPKTPQNDHF